MPLVADNLQILATLGSALAVYAFLRIGASRDVRQLRDEIKSDLAQVKDDVKEIKSDLKSIDQRLTRLEGRFDERGYWESRKRTGTEGE
jgi:Tfp pilus assembly protein PilN